MKKKESFLITGAGGYLGKELVKYLTQDKNNSLIVTTRTKSNYVNYLRNKNIYYVPNIDLTNEKQIKILRGKVNSFFRSKFHIINAVGYFPGYKYINEINIEDAKKTLEENVLSIYAIAHNFLPLMQKRKGGHFITFSTHTLYQHYPKMAIFSAAKAAVESLTGSIANEYSKYNINANTIALATLKTPIDIKLKPYADQKNWLKLGEACEIVNGLIKGGNEFINGNVIHAYKYSKTYFNTSYFQRIKNGKKK